MRRRILITGGTGFIGHYLIEEAIASGMYDVYLAIRKESQVAHLASYPQLPRVELDYTSVQQMERTFRALADEVEGPPFHHVIHNAGVTKTLDRKQFMEVNAEHTKRLLTALTAEGLPMPERFLLMSSMGSYGNNRTGRPLRSDDPQRPHTAYGQSKWQAEQYLQEFQVPYTILCPTGVYGAGDEDYWLSIMSMQRGWNFLSGREPQKLSFVYVKDVARAAIYLLNTDAASGERYLLSDGKHYTDHDFTQIVSRILQQPVHEVRVPLPVIKLACLLGQGYSKLAHKPFTLNRDKYPILSQRNWHCDISPLRAIGFEPHYDLEQGLRDAFALLEKVARAK